MPGMQLNGDHVDDAVQPPIREVLALPMLQMASPPKVGWT